MKGLIINNIMRNEVIKKYFMHISEKYKYAILHHLESIYDVDGDIDFVIDCNKLEFYKITDEFCKKNHGFIANFFTISKNIYKANIAIQINKSWTTIQLDCCTKLGNNLLNINTNSIIKDKIKKSFDSYFYLNASIQHEIEYYINKKAYKEMNFKNNTINGIDKYKDYLLSLDNLITSTQINNLYKKRIDYFKTIKFKIKKNIFKVYTLFYRIVEVNSIVLVLDMKNNKTREQVVMRLKGNHFFSNINSIKLVNKSITSFIKSVVKINYLKLQSTLIIIDGVEENKWKFLGNYIYFADEATDSINDITNKLLTLIASTMNKKYKEKYAFQ